MGRGKMGTKRPAPRAPAHGRASRAVRTHEQGEGVGKRGVFQDRVGVPVRYCGDAPFQHRNSWCLERAATARIVSLEPNDDFATLRPFLDLDSVSCSGATTAKFAKIIGSRSGGVYMPPARLRALQAAASSDKSSPKYQRMSWDALRKSITGIVNRVNITNINIFT